MTTEKSVTINYWTHETPAGVLPHQWEYLGRKAQGYRCVICQLRVTKSELKVATDA